MSSSSISLLSESYQTQFVDGLPHSPRPKGHLSIGRRDLRSIELFEVELNGEPAHLYPTKAVRRIYKLWRSKYRSKESFPSYFKRSRSAQKLSREKNTVVFWAPEWAAKHKSLTVRKGLLYRRRKPMGPGNYIFVIDSENRFLVTKKKARPGWGRTHHSSLSSGKPVLAAGAMTIRRQGDELKIKLRNSSGHYRPGPENLDKVVGWLVKHEWNGERVSDTEGSKRYLGERSIRFLSTLRGKL